MPAPPFTEFLKQPATYLWSVGVAALAGVWWARMTPTQGNMTLVGGVVALGIATALSTAGQSAFSRLLWVGTVVCPVGLFVQSQMWVPRASTLEAKTKVLTPIADTGYRDLVAEVIHAFEPSAYISIAGAVLGTDGARTVDIQVWPSQGQASGPTVVDVIDRSDRLPVGIDAVDVAEGKRRDLRAKAMLIASDTGFDSASIKKAKRIGIGLIAVVKEGDKRAKAAIEEEVYLRTVTVTDARFEYVHPGKPRQIANLYDVTYQGQPVAAWLQQRLVMALSGIAQSTSGITLYYRLRQPTDFNAPGGKLRGVTKIQVTINVVVTWAAQVIQVDATNAIYDYIRRKMRFAPGDNRYTLKNINWETATPLSEPPTVAPIGSDHRPGEMEMTLFMAKGVVPVDKLPATDKITSLIDPEDLQTEFPPLGMKE